MIYANIDGFDPAAKLVGDVGQLASRSSATAKSYRPIAERSELDRWILSELNRTCAAVVERMDAYDNYAACQPINEFVDALSNWYVRRSRDRFWAADKHDRRKARRLLDALRMSAHDRKLVLRSSRSSPRRCGRIWPSQFLASGRWRAFTCATSPRENWCANGWSTNSFHSGWTSYERSHRSGDRREQVQSSRSASR